MKTIYQLWGLATETGDWDSLLRRLERLQAAAPAAAVICGVGAPEEVSQRIFDLARRAGSEVYLWLPVFSEWDGLTEFDPLIDAWGQPFLQGKRLDGFRFRCPASPRNREAFYEESLRHLRRGDYDGVFLDRIRYPSFQFGLSGVFGCFCSACRERYRRMGLDPDALAEACRALPANGGNLLRAFDGARWTIRDQQVQALLDARCALIAEALGELTARYRTQEYKIGLDLFTPSLGYFAGQDIRRLALLADFVKPMFYMNTDAPAGLPYELDVMDRALPGARESLLGLRSAASVPEFAAREIRETAALLPRTALYCGIEYNRVMPITPIGPSEMREELRVVRGAGAAGVVLSWTLFHADDAVIDAIIEEITQ